MIRKLSNLLQKEHDEEGSYILQEKRYDYHPLLRSNFNPSLSGPID